MDGASLFRKEVLHPEQAFGPLLIHHMLHKERLIIAIGALFLLTGLWFFLGTYTEKVHVKGYIDMSPQSVALYPTGKSMIVKQYVKVGQKVQAGERLLKLQPVDDGTQVTKKKLGQTLPYLEQKLLAQIHQKKEMLQAITPLVQKHYISEKEKAALNQALFQDEKLLTELGLQKMQLRRQRHYEIFSPIGGQINEIDGAVGQWVLGDKPLLKLSPLSFHWIALLFIPVQFARFIEQGHHIHIHYDAYPYRRYGGVDGVIQLLSPLLVHQPTDTLPIPMEGPFYEVRVRLPSPYLITKSQPLPIHQGMTFEAVLYGEKKPLWKKIQEQYAHGFL